MSFLEEIAVGTVPYVPLLKKKGNLPAVFFGGGEVIVELERLLAAVGSALGRPSKVSIRDVKPLSWGSMAPKDTD